MIDNYDSFTYNLVQYLGELGADVHVYRNDAITLDADRRAGARRRSSSRPGPCTPSEAGHLGAADPALRRARSRSSASASATRRSARRSAGSIVRAQRVMHGKLSPVAHDGRGVFAGLPSPFDGDALPFARDRARDAARRASRSRRPPTTARSWACATASWPVEGVQFHPEAILTEHGHALLGNFLEGRR